MSTEPVTETGKAVLYEWTHNVDGPRREYAARRIAAIETEAIEAHFRPCAQCGLPPARHNSNLARIGDPAYAGHEYA